MSFTLIPAYGRDYKSVAEVKADLLAGKDFIVRSFSGQQTYGSAQDLLAGGETHASVRYLNLSKQVIVDLRKLEPAKPRKPRKAKAAPAAKSAAVSPSAFQTYTSFYWYGKEVTRHVFQASGDAIAFEQHEELGPNAYDDRKLVRGNVETDPRAYHPEEVSSRQASEQDDQSDRPVPEYPEY